MKNRRYLSMILLNFTALLTLIGCGGMSNKDSSTKSTEDIKVIETVLEKNFTAPDEVLLTELYDPDNATIIDQNSQGSSASLENSSNGLNQYLEDKYGDYFTDYGYEKFFTTTGVGLDYSVEADSAGYSIVTDEVSVIQDEDKPERYQFEVTVTYTDANKENNISTISGRVEMKDEKIDSLDVNDDSGLLQEMMSSH